MVNRYINPLYQRVFQAEPFFRINNVKLKVVCDVLNLRDLMKFANRPIIE